jgi:NADPH:quinone reductase-like Zn-dependent oxidoreductase
MKAVICTAYGLPEVLRVTEVRKPVPGKGEVCIREKLGTVWFSCSLSLRCSSA